MGARLDEEHRSLHARLLAIRKDVGRLAPAQHRPHGRRGDHHQGQHKDDRQQYMFGPHTPLEPRLPHLPLEVPVGGAVACRVDVPCSAVDLP